MNMKMSVLVLITALSGMPIQAQELLAGAAVAVAALWGGSRSVSNTPVVRVERDDSKAREEAPAPLTPRSKRIAKLNGWQIDAQRRADREMSEYQKEIDAINAAKRAETAAREEQARKLALAQRVMILKSTLDRADETTVRCLEVALLEVTTSRSGRDDVKRSESVVSRSSAVCSFAYPLVAPAVSVSPAAATLAVTSPAAHTDATAPVTSLAAPAADSDGVEERDPALASVSDKIVSFGGSGKATTQSE